MREESDMADKTLDCMLNLITKENNHTEINMGFPLGKEMLPPYSKNDNKLEEVNQEH